jgi:hypothetical protein
MAFQVEPKPGSLGLEIGGEQEDTPKLGDRSNLADEEILAGCPNSTGFRLISITGRPSGQRNQSRCPFLNLAGELHDSPSLLPSGVRDVAFL